MNTAAAPSGSRWVRILLVALVAACVAEGFVRLRQSVLPSPLVWSAEEQQFKERQIDNLAARGGASVVALGSSVVDASFDPSRLELGSGARPAYNAALAGAGLSMTDTWAELLVVPRLRPDAVVVGVSSREMNPNDPEKRDWERDFEDSRAVRRLKGTDNLLHKVDERLDNWSALFRYQPAIRQPRYLARLFGLGEAPTDDSYAEVGARGQFLRFLEAPYNDTDRTKRFFRRTVLNDFTIGEAQQESLAKLLRFLKQRVQQVLVVSMPTTQDLVDLHPRGAADWERFNDVVRNSAARHDAEFLEAGVWPTELFADPGHVNAAGSARFMDLVNAELQRLGWN